MLFCYYYLGIEMKRDRKKLIKLNQSRYLIKVLEKFNLIDCDLISITLSYKINEADIKLFQQIIGSLIYASNGPITGNVRCGLTM
jgi:hypothetical protein